MKSMPLCEDNLKNLGFANINKDEWVWGNRTRKFYFYSWYKIFSKSEYIPIIKYNSTTKMAYVDLGSGSFSKKIETNDIMLKLIDTASFIIES